MHSMQSSSPFCTPSYLIKITGVSLNSWYCSCWLDQWRPRVYLDNQQLISRKKVPSPKSFAEWLCNATCYCGEWQGYFQCCCNLEVQQSLWCFVGKAFAVHIPHFCPNSLHCRVYGPQVCQLKSAMFSLQRWQGHLAGHSASQDRSSSALGVIYSHQMPSTTFPVPGTVRVASLTHIGWVNIFHQGQRGFRTFHIYKEFLWTKQGHCIT